ncbi:MAG: tyrosine-type recombinase/integrase [Bacillota bacterium]
MPGKGKTRNLKKLGNNKYQIRWDLPRESSAGKRRQRMKIVNGSREEAEKELRRILTEIDQHGYVEPTKKTVEAYLQDWLACNRKNLSAKTFQRYGELIRLHVLPHLGQVRLGDLTPLRIQNYYSDLQDDGARMDSKEGGLAPATIRKIHNLLHKAFREAVYPHRILVFNPTDGVQLPKLKETDIRPLDEEQVSVFLDAAKADKHYTLFLVGMGTGLRRGELFGLKWGDVDLDKQLLFVRRSLVTVGGKPVLQESVKTDCSRRTIAISSELVVGLKQHRLKQNEQKRKAGSLWQEMDLIFCSEIGTPLNPDNFAARHFLPLIEKAGLPRLRFHDLRHTHATLMIKSGEDTKVVSKRLGHSDVAFIMRVIPACAPKR